MPKQEGLRDAMIPWSSSCRAQKQGGEKGGQGEGKDGDEGKVERIQLRKDSDADAAGKWGKKTLLGMGQPRGRGM